MVKLINQAITNLPKTSNDLNQIVKLTMTNDNVLPSLTQAWVKFSDKNVEEATQAIFKSSELRGNVEVGPLPLYDT